MLTSTVDTARYPLTRNMRDWSQILAWMTSMVNVSTFLSKKTEQPQPSTKKQKQSMDNNNAKARFLSGSETLDAKMVREHLEAERNGHPCPIYIPTSASVSVPVPVPVPITFPIRQMASYVTENNGAEKLVVVPQHFIQKAFGPKKIVPITKLVPEISINLEIPPLVNSLFAHQGERRRIKSIHSKEQESVYFGEVDEHDSPNGLGTMVSNENTYSGGWKSGKRNGKGMEKNYAKNYSYEGDFVMDEFSGKGKLTKIEGGILKVYEGDFLNGKLNGTGKISFSNGEVYEGQLASFQREGKGAQYYKKDDPQGRVSYVGDWKNNKRHGKGIMYFKDWIYEGEFHEHEMHGMGYSSTSNPAKPCEFFYGPYVNGKRHGMHIFVTDHGRSECVFSNGDIVK